MCQRLCRGSSERCLRGHQRVHSGKWWLCCRDRNLHQLSWILELRVSFTLCLSFDFFDGCVPCCDSGLLFDRLFVLFDRCSRGWTGNGVQCIETDVCRADLAYGTSCLCLADNDGRKYSCPTVVNECATSNGGCSADSVCVKIGSEVSCQCPVGYVRVSGVCVDANECGLGKSSCSSQANCTNTVGSFTCACNAGFSGSGVVCSDIDECSVSTFCDPSAGVCTNSVGSFSCACRRGYSGDGLTCQQVMTSNSNPYFSGDRCHALSSRHCISQY